MSIKKNKKNLIPKAELDLDIDIIRGITARAIFEFIFFAIVLFGMAYFAHCKMTNLINETLKASVSRHMGTISHIVEHEFAQELKEMHLGAGMVEQGKVTVENLISVSDAFEKGTNNSGILRMDGSSIDNNHKTLPQHEFDTLHDVFFGKDVISYHEGQGLIFAVPIKINDEYCAFYQKYSDRDISKLFGVVSYDGAGHILLGNNEHEAVPLTISEEYDEIYEQLFKSSDFLDSFEDNVIEEMDEHDNNGRAVSAYEYNDQSYLIFGVKVYDNKFAVLGVVPREAVSVGIDYIHLVMLGVMGLLFLVLIMFARYSIKNVQNKELEQEKLMALQASKTKSDFLSNMSHEIRTPINAILGMDEMILRESKEPFTLEYAENLRHAGVNLLGIVNDILDFSKIEAGKMEIIPVEYQLSSVLNDLVNMIHPRAKKKGLMFIANANPKLPSILFGDEIRIKQIITNILTNAVKYTEKGSVTLNVDYKDKGTDGILLEVSVVDTGIGIKEEDIAKLFSAFERIEEKRNRTIEGTGLGMNITQQLLNLMGSQLQVTSVYGKGSTFAFEIEQKVISRDPIGSFEEAFRRSLKQHKAYQEKFTAPDAKILVVDDTTMNLTVVKGLLKQTKIKIETAESGYECLDMIVKKKYDVIFLDHRMPGIDGIETLKKMKEIPININLNADTPIISLTANAISGAREQYIAAGFKDYLTKPINSVNLENMLIKYLPKDKVIITDSEDNVNVAADDNSSSNIPEWLTKVEGLNIEDGIKHCGDVDSYLEVLNVYANSVVIGADEIEKFYKNEDWQNYTTKVHALKSSSKVIGANELSERAKRLEDAGTSGYIDEIKNDTQPLLDLYRSYAEKLSPLIEIEEDDSDKPLIDDSELAEAYEAMKDSAATFDYDSLMFVIQSLNDYKLPDSEVEKYKNIKSAADKLDWETIKKLLNE